MIRSGIVTGFRAEVRCLRPAAGAEIACSGGSAHRARSQAERLVARGVGGLVSFGLAGGLAPALAPGDLILADAVVLPGGIRIATDHPWRCRLLLPIEAAGMRPHRAAVAGSDRLLTTVADKRRLFAATGAGVVDMESHAVAAAAQAAGLPFLVLRAVADPAHQALPLAATVALGPRGEVRLLAVTRALLARPAELPAVLRLGGQSRQALTALRRVVLLAGSALERV